MIDITKLKQNDILIYILDPNKKVKVRIPSYEFNMKSGSKEILTEVLTGNFGHNIINVASLNNLYLKYNIPIKKTPKIFYWLYQGFWLHQGLIGESNLADIDNWKLFCSEKIKIKDLV